MKKCLMCLTEKPLVDFMKCKRSPDGLHSYCRPCKAIYSQSHRNEKRRAYERSYYVTNKESITSKRREYYAKDIVKSRAYVRQQAYLLRLRNPMRDKEKQQGLKNIYSRLKSTARRKKILCDLSLQQFLSLVEGACCFYCGDSLGKSFSWQLDRIDSGTGYTFSNVRACCSVCNYAKHCLSETAFREWVFRIATHWLGMKNNVDNASFMEAAILDGRKAAEKIRTSRVD